MAGDDRTPFWFGPAMVLAMAALLLLLPVIIPFVAVTDGFGRRRLHQAAAWSRCLRCAHPMGQQGLSLADSAWAQHVDAIRQAYPHHMLRMVRTVRAICPRCSQRHAFDETTRRFRLAERPV